jgi:hypothetical protein
VAALRACVADRDFAALEPAAQKKLLKLGARVQALLR